MSKRKLQQYQGSLNPQQVAAGINAAIANAKRLADDASVLLEHGQYPSALSLAALSIEESGKTSILRALALARNPDDTREAWREYRSHTRKNVGWLFPELVSKGGRRLGDFKSLFDEGAEHPFMLDKIKQLGLYTDCLGNANWSIPTQVVDEDLSRSVIRIAQLLASTREVTEKEMELWVKCLKPVWKGNMEQMEAALAQWYQEMQREGLAPKGENVMEKFILYGVGRSQDE